DLVLTLSLFSTAVLCSLVGEMSQISSCKKRVRYCSVPAQCRGRSICRRRLQRSAAGLRRNVLVDVARQRLLLRNVAEQFFQVRELDAMPRYCSMVSWHAFRHATIARSAGTAFA